MNTFDLATIIQRWRDQACEIDRQIEHANKMQLHEGTTWILVERAHAIRKCADELQQRMTSLEHETTTRLVD